MDEPQTRRRWPWIVAGLLVFCGLPLGGCVALVGFGVREVNERSDQIGDSGNLVVTMAIAGDGEALYIESLKRLSMRLGVAQNCQFLGYQSGNSKDLLLQGADLQWA